MRIKYVGPLIFDAISIIGIIYLSIKQLDARPDTGLTPGEVKKKLAEFGYNEVHERRRAPF